MNESRDRILGALALRAVLALMRIEAVQQVNDRGSAGEGWQSEALVAALGLANAVVALENDTRPMMMCSCADFMACEHPYPARLGVVKGEPT